MANDDVSTSGLGPVDGELPAAEPDDAAAGGLEAVASGLGYALRRAGVVRSVRTLLRVNQPDGFDCPSCAWPDPERRATLEFCENGARAVADEATTRRIGRDFFARYGIEELRRQSDVWLNAQGRITEPMVRDGDHYVPISYEDALDLVARELRALASPDEALFYTSGRTSNEAAFLYQLMVRAFGTNNLPDCSNMCHESSGIGLSEVIGVGKGTVQLADFELADVIFVIGQNPGTNHPRMLTTLREAKRRGCKIIVMNPLRESGLLRFQHPQKALDMLGEGTAIADLYLQVQVGADIPALKAIMKALLARGACDVAFIGEHTDGFTELRDDLARYDLESLCRLAGLRPAEVDEAAALIAGAPRVIFTWAMGITQHVHGVGNVQEIANLALLGGHVGRPGTGLCPVRGHSNVQGDRTMGIWEQPPGWIERLEQACGFTAPRRVGHDTVGAIRAMHDGGARLFFGLGGNFLSATPDTGYTARALERCHLTAHVSTKLNRAHLVTGQRGLILPCLGRTERDVQASGPQFVTVEDSMGVVHRSEGRLAPAAPGLWSEVRIVAELGARLLGEARPVAWRELAANYDSLRELIGRVVPGFAAMNERVRAPNGFVLPNAARERRFDTATKRARFTVQPLPDLTLARGELRMTTIRSHDQFNTTLYDVNDRYRGLYGHRRVVLMHPDDIAEHQLTQGQHVTLVSVFAGRERRAPSFVVVPYDVPRSSVATYFPEANPLVPVEQFADKSRTPASKSVRIRIEAE